MIAVIVSFTDNPARLELRPRHRQLLEELHEQGLLLAAGPFGDQSGALLLFATDDVAAVEAALARDPYYEAPGVRIEKIQPWSVVAGAVAGPQRSRQTCSCSASSHRSSPAAAGAAATTG